MTEEESESSQKCVSPMITIPDKLNPLTGRPFLSTTRTSLCPTAMHHDAMLCLIMTSANLSPLRYIAMISALASSSATYFPFISSPSSNASIHPTTLLSLRPSPVTKTLTPELLYSQSPTNGPAISGASESVFEVCLVLKFSYSRRRCKSYDRALANLPCWTSVLM
ncbi:hypothetical protein Mp_1g15640 [Marchantia polymorpha subsp. ruderalis]|uniref:Uncharacterized protein n=2 Tax=Marchantia polymorpha TaxID=3197 RepID=A0AAF6AQJ1_MARPO|nr:hypothetical protein MARPO_0033s0097 [Marchantia polymorpha]BBM98711.1 hypothetical protein Mp_1g15640 [Marchantia polymorpha subsp. ruderalis]|eukprot:PTQ41695.1 hypothetical protein MARPO_0033s0097 [Marchantia polymorpha]